LDVFCGPRPRARPARSARAYGARLNWQVSNEQLSQGTSSLKTGTLTNTNKVNVSGTGNTLDGETVSNTGYELLAPEIMSLFGELLGLKPLRDARVGELLEAGIGGEPDVPFEAPADFVIDAAKDPQCAHRVRNFFPGGFETSTDQRTARSRNKGTSRKALESGIRVIGMVDRLQLLDLAFGIILDHDFQRPQHCHAAQRRLVEVLPDAELEHADIDHAVGLGHADALDEFADRRRRHAAALQAGHRRHARIVPACDMAVAHQLGQHAFRQQRVGEVQPRELVLSRL
jgi:hypothetical protein